MTTRQLLIMAFSLRLFCQVKSTLSTSTQDVQSVDHAPACSLEVASRLPKSGTNVKLKFYKPLTVSKQGCCKFALRVNLPASSLSRKFSFLEFSKIT